MELVASCATVRDTAALGQWLEPTAQAHGRALGKEHSLFPGKVVITVHPRIKPGDADEMCAQAQAAIESALPEEYRYKPASK